jgi:uncharacterized membrane protein
MDYYLLLLRILHIGGGVYWVGGVLIMAFYISPTVSATAESGQKFIDYLMNNKKFSAGMTRGGVLTILAGLLLYWHDSSGFTSAWMRSGAGIGFGIGAGFALIGFIFGILVGRKTKAMVHLGAQFQGKPTDEQMLQMQSLKKQQTTYLNLSAVTLVLALWAMAIARYLVF